MSLSTLIGHARLAYIEADTELRVASWNQGAVHLFGYSEDDTMGKALCELVPLDRDDLRTCRKTRVATCCHKNIEGREIQSEIFFTPIMNFHGDRLGMAVLAKDISARLKDKESLRQKEQHLADISGFAPIGMYHVDMDGKVVSANPEYAWMMGYESSDAIIEQMTDFAGQAFFDPDRAEEFMFGVYEAEEVARFRCRLKRKDQSFIWAQCYAKATRNKTGRISGFSGFSIDISETVRAEQALKEANERLKKLTVIDGLTQIPNRRRFDEYLVSEWKRHFRTREPMSMVLCDIDFFKFYNDTYGHQAGDDCLRKVAKTIAGCVQRSADLTARYGGEEFAIILPATDAAGAMMVSENVRYSIMDLELKHEKSAIAGYITLSLGVATMIPDDDNSAETLVSFADECLYEAKELGRNQSIGKDLS